MTFHVFILWLHLLAGMIWVGGLVFQLLVVPQTLARATTTREQLRLGLGLESRFRAVMWPAIGVVLLTGLFNVINLLYAVMQGGGTLPTTFTYVLTMKILLVVVMVGLQTLQQLVIRPKRIAGFQAVAADATLVPPPLAKLQRLSQLLYLLIVLLAVVVVLLALLLRG